MKLSKVFQNKYLLYIVLVVAVTNVLGYLAKEQYNAVTFFLAIGLLSSYFTKNMTVVLLISILSTALASTQRIVEGVVGSMENKIVVNKPMEKIVEKVGEGSDGIAAQEGFPPGVTATFDSAGNTLKISGTPTEAGEFNYTVNFVKNADGESPSPATGSIKVEAAAEKPASDKKGVCKAKDPNDDPGNCGDYKLETECVGKCKWNPIIAQPEKQAIKASEAAKGKDVDEFKKFCLEGLKDANGATHTKGDGNDMEYFKQHLYDNQGKCPIASSVESCENSNDCKEYKSFSGEKFTNMGKRNNIVANSSREGRVDGVDESEGDRIDYAETTKQAYDNLQKMLGADGMKGLASETKKLVAQQKELVDSLGQMAPVLNSAKSTLDSLNLPDMKGITNILSTLKGK
tara:strand:- start:950 stop:2155 length:1206 start_codon:yes stop_codon:yes gene_type:complete